MIQALNTRKGQINDEMLFSMLCLSANGADPLVRRGNFSKIHARKTLLRAFGAEYYGAVDPEMQHLQVLYKLLEHHGGIHTIRSRSVQFALIM